MITEKIGITRFLAAKAVKPVAVLPRADTIMPHYIRPEFLQIHYPSSGRAVGWEEELRADIQKAIAETAERHKLDLRDPAVSGQVREAFVSASAAAGVEAPPPSPPPLTVPQSWEEAKAQVPGLLRFAEARAANPKLSIIDHLRDEQRGYGKWTKQEPGMPRSLFVKWGDKATYYAINDWLKNHEMPPDIHTPTLKEVTDILADKSKIPGDRPVRVDWALRKRRQRERAAQPQTP